MNYINAISVIGIFLLFYSVIILLLPPKFGNRFLGIYTKETIRNESVWKQGQKIMAIGILIIVIIFIFLSFIEIQNTNLYFGFVLLLIVLWKLTKIMVDKFLHNKLSEEEN